MNEPLQAAHRWKPIEDLSDSEKALARPELHTLANIWKGHLAELANTEAMRHFNARLARHWAIETGIIEGIYKIDRGITELLIEKGIETALIPHGATDRPAEAVVAILRDHETVLEGLFDFIASRRSLSTSYIKEIHQNLCAHQDTVEARDAQGRSLQPPLLKGAWKRHPNNPHRANGLLHEYCPPEQTASEMDRLIAMHHQHGLSNVAPEVEAAWLHHRFSQIHPFQDGNGRVARALASLVLLRAQLFPFTVDRSEREAYISNLEKADAGEFGPLVEMIAKAQRKALVKALSISESLITATTDIHALIQGSAKALKEKTTQSAREFESVYEMAERLQQVACRQMEQIAQTIQSSLESVDPTFQCVVVESTPEQTQWYHSQVVHVARELEYFADMRRYHHWIRMRIQESHISSIIVSFHPLGTRFRGIMAASAFYEQRPAASDQEPPMTPIPFRLNQEVFEFTFSDLMENVTPRFEEWLHDTLMVGLTQWKNSIEQ